MYSSARRNRASSPELPSSPLYSPTPFPPSPMIPTIPDEDDEHTLCAYGDISLTEQCFLPSLPSNVQSPVEGDTVSRPRRLSSAAAAHPPRGAMANRPRPPIMLKSKNPYDLIAKAAIAQLKLSLKEIVDHMKAKGKFNVPPPIKVVARTPAPVQRSPLSANTPNTPPLTPTSAPLSPCSPVTPKSPKKPFRGYGPMPRRSPLPKWDEVYPDLPESQYTKKTVV
ncbi:hypothetical protein BDZ89DRAFT_1156234 [Hymenopellis radicata]|nr:hypothetical protein BDZ89DRAFT_1156234 [Hymenopellis radicata]